jgi:hypothetical protein
MLYPSRLTIREVLESVGRNLYVLPPIKREFLCDPEDICRLFDDLMLGRPLDTFLFWKIAPEKTRQFKFYGFVQNYDQRDASHCPELHAFPEGELTAVIDGQQCLTALNIGLRGSMTIRECGRWRKTRSTFTKKFLHLDLLARKREVTEGKAYSFEFKTAEKATQDRAALWYPVPTILEAANTGALMQWLILALQQRGFRSDMDLFTRAGNTLRRLYEVVHATPAITFHSEKSQELDRDVRIFLRMNDACSLTFKLVASFGFEDHNARAETELLPIAYYLFKRNPPDSWLFAPASQAEREQIRSWLIRSSYP